MCIHFISTVSVSALIFSYVHVQHRDQHELFRHVVHAFAVSIRCLLTAKLLFFKKGLFVAYLFKRK